MKQESQRPVGTFGTAKRRTVTVSQQELVTNEFLGEKPLPLVIKPAVQELNLLAWAENNRQYIETSLLKYGGLLFRGFNVREVADFDRFMSIVAGELLPYQERSSPRSQVFGNVYTSTDYPATQQIYVHNENSYQSKWPLKIFFFCKTAALQGGETPIADVRRVMARLDPTIVDRFLKKQVMYVRNFGEGLGLSWQDVFQTTDRSVVEEHCRNNGITLEWISKDRLRTRAIRPAIARHPRTEEITWFNHATFFHVTTREPEIRDALLMVFAEEDLPTNTYYGDGSPIESDVLDQLRDAYDQELVAFPWQEGDIMMLDNMLVAHGRGPYSGPRRILVGMAELITDRNV